MRVESSIKKNGFLYSLAHVIYDAFRTVQYSVLFIVFSLLPLRNRVIASAFDGKKYGDNSKYVVEKIHELDPSIEIVWLCDPGYSYNTPEYVKKVYCTDRRCVLKRCYYYFTSKVWINTHLYDKYLHKRSGQLVIETWHGGLGIKKIEGDVAKFASNRFQVNKIKKTSRLADIFISNSKFLSDIYRKAFFFDGTIWEVGFPKDEPLFRQNGSTKEKVCGWFGIENDSQIIVYAPTYRGGFEDSGIIDMSPYDLDLNMVKNACEAKTGKKCVVIKRWHPSMSKFVSENMDNNGDIIDGTSYPEMQDLIIASDIFISDYSSCIFEAALKNIPCYIYANDYDDYLGDRGAYFALNELPFPYATTNKDMCSLIQESDLNDSITKWNGFVDKMGLNEDGNASYNIALLITRYCNGDVQLIKEVTAEKTSRISFV